MDGLHHPFEHRVEYLARLLWIPVGEQLHGALEVGEENGDLLPLAFEGRFRVQDTFSEVLRRVAVGRGKASFRGCRSGYGMGTLRAELRRGRKLATTVRATPAQRGCALFAELRPGTILVLAPGTLHLTLASQGGGGRNGGTTLAPAHHQGQQRLLAMSKAVELDGLSVIYPEGSEARAAAALSSESSSACQQEHRPPTKTHSRQS
jgi:hypothetical protein